MPITVEWDTPHKIAVRFTYQRPWTWKDFDVAVEQTIALLDEASQKIDIIFDLRQGGLPPADAVRRFKAAAEIRHPHAGQYIYVASPILTQFVKGVIQILNRTYSGFGTFEVPSIVFTGSLEEARDYLAHQRQIAAKAG